MVDRREFLKGLAAAWMATRVISDVYDLVDDEVKFMLPQDVSPGKYTDLMVRLHGNNRTIKWPKNIRWQNEKAPALTAGMDVVHFETYDGKEWYGSYALDLT